MRIVLYMIYATQMPFLTHLSFSTFTWQTLTIMDKRTRQYLIWLAIVFIMALGHGLIFFFFPFLVPTQSFCQRTTLVNFLCCHGDHQCIRMYASSLVPTTLCVLLYVCYYIAANAVAAIASIVATAKALMLLLLFFPKYHLTPDLP